MQTEKEAQAKPNDYNLQPLIQGYEFARNHNMDIRINALVFFKDFPDRLIGESADAYKTALESYGKAISFVANEYAAKGVPTTIDMFNEFVDYNAPFSERTNNWMSKLSVEDLCKIALTLKQEMPDVDFGYNDWNFENPDKRKTIFEVIRKIQEFERQNNCKIIDHIGTQCHTSINDIEELRKSIEELQQFGLPVDITELDISKGLKGVDYERATQEELRAIRKYEQKLQNDMMKMMSEFVRDGKVRGITSWSITDELCCDFCDGKQASVTDMSYDSKTGFTFSGKDMDKEIEMTLEEMQLIQEHISRITEKDYEIARAIIGEQILEQLHIVTEHKELEESTKKQTKTKSIQGLVQESIEGVPDLTILDDIEQAQARQQRTIIEQREGQNYSQNIGD